MRRNALRGLCACMKPSYLRLRAALHVPATYLPSLEVLLTLLPGSSHAVCRYNNNTILPCMCHPFLGGHRPSAATTAAVFVCSFVHTLKYPYVFR